MVLENSAICYSNLGNLKNLTKGIDKKIDLYSFCDVTEEEVTAYNSDQMEELE